MELGAATLCNFEIILLNFMKFYILLNFLLLLMKVCGFVMAPGYISRWF